MTRREPSRSLGTTFLCLLACLLTVGCTAPASPPDATKERGEDVIYQDVIYQVATLNSLLEGNFEGTETVGDLRGRGTLGLGTVDQLDERLPPATPLYAFRVTGDFDDLQTRSVPAQQPPYPKLETVIANQTRFTFDNVTGTMVGSAEKRST